MESSQKRRITVQTNNGTQTYKVLSVERTGVPNAYLLRFAWGSGEWLNAGTYNATVFGKTTVRGTVGIINYEKDPPGKGIPDEFVFVGVFRPADNPD